MARIWPENCIESLGYDLLSRNSGLNGGQPKSCFGKPRAKSKSYIKAHFPRVDYPISTYTCNSEAVSLPSSTDTQSSRLYWNMLYSQLSFK